MSEWWIRHDETVGAPYADLVWWASFLCFWQLLATANAYFSIRRTP